MNIKCIQDPFTTNMGQQQQFQQERMADYSYDLQLPGHVQVYALGLMQSIIGRPIKSTFSEQQLNVLPWKGWDELHDTGERRVTSPSQGVSDDSDTSNRFTSTLVALRSSQIMAPICPSLEITPDDLLDIGTAVSCFSKLCGAADTDAYLKALVAVLAEWEGLFVVGKDGKNSAEVTDAGNEWENDDWNEGWESFQEVEPLNTENKGSSLSLHPLHACWSELIQRHVALSIPFFICELVKVDQKMLAGFIITKYMHTNASLSLINMAEAGLRRFLEGQLNELHHADFDLKTTCPDVALRHAISSLLGRLVDLIPPALSSLSER